MNLLGRQNRLNRLGVLSSETQVPSVVSLTGLISHWKLDDLTWADSHGTNPLAQGGANDVFTTTGKLGSAVNCVAADQSYLNIASNASLQTGDIDFTITLWVYLATLPAGLTPVLGKWDSTPVTGILASEWRLVLEGNNQDFEFIATNGVDTLGVEDGALTNTATWYFLAFGYDATNNVIRLSRNAADYSLGSLPSVASSNTAFRIGHVVADSKFHNGRVDEVSFWKRLLTVSELLLLYNNGNGFAYPFGN